MERRIEVQHKASLMEAIQAWLDNGGNGRDDLPFVGEDIAEVMAECAHRPVPVTADAQACMRAEGMLED